MLEILQAQDSVNEAQGKVSRLTQEAKELGIQDVGRNLNRGIKVFIEALNTIKEDISSLEAKAKQYEKLIEIFQAKKSVNKAQNTLNRLTQKAKKLGINDVKTALNKDKETLKKEIKDIKKDIAERQVKANQLNIAIETHNYPIIFTQKADALTKKAKELGINSIKTAMEENDEETLKKELEGIKSKMDQNAKKQEILEKEKVKVENLIRKNHSQINEIKLALEETLPTRASA